MSWDVMFFLNAALLGVGLAMDAFSVSIANALGEPKMKLRRMCGIAGVYAFFQLAMPMIGWFCVHTIREYFVKFQKFIPWIALLLLLYIGGKMLIEGIRDIIAEKKAKDEKAQSEKTKEEEGKNDSAEETAKSTAVTEKKKLTFGVLMVQGVATSIDALSVGFTTAEYSTAGALVSSVIIAVVTFAICMTGLKIGKIVGNKVSSKATVIGGLILIGIGIEIFVKGMIGG